MIAFIVVTGYLVVGFVVAWLFGSVASLGETED